MLTPQVCVLSPLLYLLYIYDEVVTFVDTSVVGLSEGSREPDLLVSRQQPLLEC